MEFIQPLFIGLGILYSILVLLPKFIESRIKDRKKF